MSGFSKLAVIAATWRTRFGSMAVKGSDRVSDPMASPRRLDKLQEGRLMALMATAFFAVVCVTAVPTEAATSKMQAGTDISRMLGNTAFLSAARNVETALAVHRPRAKLDANHMFLSSLGPRYLPRAWVSLYGKAFEGPRRGHSASFSLGIESPAKGRLTVGIIGALSQAEIRHDKLGVSVRSAAIGPYFSRRFGPGSSLSGWLLVSRPRYRLDRSAWHATRWRGVISFEQRFELKRSYLTARARVASYGEDHPKLSGAPGGTISSIEGKLKGEVTFRPRKEWQPHVGFGFDMDLDSEGAFGRRSRTNQSMDAGLRYVRDRSKIGLGISASRVRRSPVVSVDLKMRF